MDKIAESFQRGRCGASGPAVASYLGQDKGRGGVSRVSDEPAPSVKMPPLNTEIAPSIFLKPDLILTVHGVLVAVVDPMEGMRLVEIRQTYQCDQICSD